MARKRNAPYLPGPGTVVMATRHYTPPGAPITTSPGTVGTVVHRRGRVALVWFSALRWHGAWYTLPGYWCRMPTRHLAPARPGTPPLAPPPASGRQAGKGKAPLQAP